MGYVFLSPDNEACWTAYHDIRRTVLFERRGRFGIYDPDHIDEFKANHFPKLLLLDGTPIGVIRIDLDGVVARFRRVAIAENHQGQGHGRALMAHAQAFASEQGAARILASVAADAVGFYRRLGFQVLEILDQGSAVRVVKELD